MNKNRIKELRKEKGLTQQQMAKELGLPYTTYINYENGYRNIPNKLLGKLESAFGVSASVILNIDNGTQGEINRGMMHYLTAIDNFDEKEHEDALRILDSLFDFANALIKNNEIELRNMYLDRLLVMIAKLNNEGIKALIKEASVISIEPEFTRKE